MLVLGMGMLVSVMVLGVLINNRIQARSTAQSSDSLFAETLAESAVDYAIVALNANAAWRTTYVNNVESPTVALNGGTISFKLIDEISGNLTTTTTNPVRIYGIGRYGTATRVYSVRVEGKNALTCLNAAIMVGGNLAESNASSIQASGFIVATNAKFIGNTSGGASTVNANVEAVSTITPNSASISGTSTAGVAARLMPVSTVISTYVAMGTPIVYSSIPSGIIQNVVISPASNPYSSTALNLKGIYVIDCGGSNLEITHCRIVGTLVILNPGSSSSIGAGTGSADQINWVPAVSSYPCLLVSGDMEISFASSSGQTLKETDLSAGIYNFNPPGTPYPYPSGSTNILVLDTYPSIIDGLVYISGNFTGNSITPTYPSIGQIIVGGTFDPGRDIETYNYKGAYLVTPPPGFRGGGTLVAVPSSWRWEPVP